MFDAPFIFTRAHETRCAGILTHDPYVCCLFRLRLAHRSTDCLSDASVSTTHHSGRRKSSKQGKAAENKWWIGEADIQLQTPMDGEPASRCLSMSTRYPFFLSLIDDNHTVKLFLGWKIRLRASTKNRSPGRAGPTLCQSPWMWSRRSRREGSSPASCFSKTRYMLVSRERRGKGKMHLHTGASMFSDAILSEDQ